MTARVSPFVPVLKISTHTLTWSVTARVSPFVPVLKISTHTLTWSVTLGYYFGTEYKLNFNSHAHVERDSMTAVTQLSPQNFNSHAHVERDSIRPKFA